MRGHSKSITYARHYSWQIKSNNSIVQCFFTSTTSCIYLLAQAAINVPNQHIKAIFHISTYIYICYIFFKICCASHCWATLQEWFKEWELVLIWFLVFKNVQQVLLWTSFEFNFGTSWNVSYFDLLLLWTCHKEHSHSDMSTHICGWFLSHIQMLFIGFQAQLGLWSVSPTRDSFFSQFCGRLKKLAISFFPFSSQNMKI